MVNINNKVKQFFGGNWSSNKFTKKHTNIPKDFGNEKTKHQSIKRKKRAKKKYIYAGDVCPFCGAELEVIPKPKDSKLGWYYSIFKNRKQKCSKCNSQAVQDCPACYRSTWYNPETKIYKHQHLGCGFEGERLNERPKKNK